METGGKIAIGLGIAGIVGAVIYSATKAKAAPENNNVTVTFTPVGRYASRIAALSGSTPVLEGQQTVLTVIVTNTSTQNGQPVAASLTTKIDVKTTDGTVVLAVQTNTDNYAANGTKTYSYTVTAPLGKGGQSLGGYANVYDPNGNFLNGAAASEPIASIEISVVLSTNYSYIYWDALGSWLSIPAAPPVPLNAPVSIGLSWQNSSNIPIVGHAALNVVYPDGSVVNPTVAQGQDQTGAINQQVTGVVFSSFNASKVGTYTLTETISYQGVVLATVTYTIVVQAATGTVGPGIIWYEGLAGWESLVSGRQVPVGVPITIAPLWTSDSIVGHVTLLVDGVAISAILNQDKLGNSAYVEFAEFTLSAGTHTCVVTLSSGGQTLDTVTFTLVAISPINYGATIVIS